MKLHTLNLVKSIKFYLITIYVYFFIAFLPKPWSINLGLDPSWSYAISQAAQEQFVFGKDIVFTYGPLGYLIAGATLESNFLQITSFRLLIYLLLFVVSIIRILTLKNSIHQLLIGSSILFAFLAGGMPYVGVGMFTDYHILFIYLMILSFDNIFKKYPLLTPLILGAVSGFCFLTKFSLGVYTFGSLILFLLINLYDSIKIKSKAQIFIGIFAILNSLLAAVSVSWIFLVPADSLFYVSQVIIFLLISSVSGLSISLIQKHINYKSQFQNKSSLFHQLINNPFLPWLIFYLIYSFLLTHTILFSSSHSLMNFFRNSLEISSGYSSSMSTVGRMSVMGAKIRLSLAFSILGIILLLLFFVIKNGHLNFSLALLFVLLIALKHGFIRQDGHVVVFSMIMPLIAALCISKIKQFRHLKISYYFFIYIVMASLLISSFELPNQVSQLMPQKIYYNKLRMMNFNALSHKINNRSSKILADNKLSANVRELLSDKPIDIIPWEVSLVPANNLNWHPRPIFQSYSAYTKTLDNMNFVSLSENPRDYILYNFSSIDRRHPFFDEPKTFFYVFCNYKPSSKTKDFINTSALKNVILLERFQSSRCSSISSSELISIPWNTYYNIDAASQEVIRANVLIKYTLLGKIVKAIFRIPPVFINVNYLDGTSQQYRIIQDNSENGVIISHLPRTDDEALSFFKGELLANVRSFSFENSNSLLFKPDIKITFIKEILK